MSSSVFILEYGIKVPANGSTYLENWCSCPNSLKSVWRFSEDNLHNFSESAEKSSSSWVLVDYSKKVSDRTFENLASNFTRTDGRCFANRFLNWSTSWNLEVTYCGARCPSGTCNGTYRFWWNYSKVGWLFNVVQWRWRIKQKIQCCYRYV